MALPHRTRRCGSSSNQLRRNGVLKDPKRTLAGGAALVVASLTLVWALIGTKQRPQRQASDLTGARPSPENRVPTLRSPTGVVEPRSVSAVVAEQEESLPSSVGYSEWKPPAYEDWLTIGALGRIPTADAVFDSKYTEAMTREELRTVLLDKMESFTESVQEHARIRWEAGVFDRVPAPPTDDRGFFPKNWVGDKQDWPAHAFLMGGEVPEGFVDIVWLPFTEYPDIYDTQDEHRYLSRRMNSAPKD